jgi:hypothetical protein
VKAVATSPPSAVVPKARISAETHARRQNRRNDWATADQLETSQRLCRPVFYPKAQRLALFIPPVRYTTSSLPSTPSRRCHKGVIACGSQLALLWAAFFCREVDLEMGLNTKHEQVGGSADASKTQKHRQVGG